MFLPSAPEISVESSGQDVRYDLPARPLGKLRLFGLIPVAFSVLFISAPARWVFGFIRDIHHGKNSGFEYFVILFFCVFIFAGLIPASIGLLLLGGRCRIIWRDRRLTIIDHFGPVRWSRRLPKSPLHKLVVLAGGAKINDKPVTSGPLATLAALTAEFESGKPRAVLVGYPKDWVQAVADDLSSRVGTSCLSAGQPVEVVHAEAEQPELEDVVKRPASSQVNIEHGTASLKLQIPPSGLNKGSKSLFFFGIVWCLFMTLFTAATIFGKSQDSHPQSPLVLIPFLCGFWLIGLSLLTIAIHISRRRANILVQSNELRVEQIGLFGTKTRVWNPREIVAVHADASGMEVNHKPVINLQLHFANGKKFGFLGGRDEEELRWLATELRKTLNVPGQKPNPSQGSAR